MCVPKEGLGLDTEWPLQHSGMKCTDPQIPSRLLDRKYPRVYRFASTEGPDAFELGLDYDADGSCLVKSIFFNDIKR